MPELDLIRAIQAALTDRGGRTVRWTGDDAAVVRARPLAVTSIDTVVDGVHFSLATHSAGGRRAGRRWPPPLSDLAAMGAEPGEAYVALVLPAGFDGGARAGRARWRSWPALRRHDRRRRRRVADLR